MARRKWTREEIEEYRKTHVWYFNPQDSNIFVPKKYGIGLSFNFAHPIIWVAIAIVLAFVIWRLVVRLTY